MLKPRHGQIRVGWCQGISPLAVACFQYRGDKAHHRIIINDNDEINYVFLLSFSCLIKKKETLTANFMHSPPFDVRRYCLQGKNKKREQDVTLFVCLASKQMQASRKKREGNNA